jgi:hypothetical protein
MPLCEALVVSPAEGVVPMIAAQGKWRKLDGKKPPARDYGRD